MENHSYMPRYRAVWEQTIEQGALPLDQIEKSRYYFESDLSTPTPRSFEPYTYGIAALLPMPESARQVFTGLWNEVMESLGHPVAYGVEPHNRHVELLVFTRPEELVDEATVQKNVEASYQALKAEPPKPFKITYCRPFITPDGTVVVPGFPEPSNIIDDLRAKVREVTHDTLPRKQSQWFHTPIGRILEPIDADKLQPVLRDMEARWGETVLTLDINELLWTCEYQWYMVRKKVLHKVILGS